MKRKKESAPDIKSWTGQLFGKASWGQRTIESKGFSDLTDKKLIIVSLQIDQLGVCAISNSLGGV